MTKSLLKCSCVLCNNIVTVNQLYRHYNSKQCKNKKVGFTKQYFYTEDNLECTFCSKQCKNKNALVQHVSRCKNNPKNIGKLPKPKSEKWKEAMKARQNKGTNQYTKAKEKGEKYITSEETKQKLREINLGKKHKPETIEKISKGMQKAVLENPDSYSANNVCGRVKIVEYKGEQFHGSWEVEVAKWLDKNLIEWTRKVDPIQYHWNNGLHSYFPDFYLPKLDMYVEVKGYETDRDRQKWKAVNNLIVIKKDQIEQIKSNTYKI